MLSKHYDWQLIKEMPLADLDGLLFYAQKQETQKALTPLWLVHFAIAKLTRTEYISPEEFFGEAQRTKITTQRSSEEIINEFAPIIAADRKRGRADG